MNKAFNNQSMTKQTFAAFVFAVCFLPFHFYLVASAARNPTTIISDISGKTLDNLEVSTLDGESKKLDEIVKGKKLTLFQFWATWCPACRAESAHLAVLNEKFKERGFQVIPISIDDNIEELRNFLNKTPTFHTGYVDKTKKFSEQLKVRGVPSAVLVDSNLKVVSVFTSSSVNASAKIKSQLNMIEGKYE